MNTTTWLSLFTLGCLTSLDVGVAALAMGTKGRSAAASIVFVSVFTATAVATGLILGSRLNQAAGRYAEITGGSLLVGIAEYRCFF